MAAAGPRPPCGASARYISINAPRRAAKRRRKVSGFASRRRGAGPSYRRSTASKARQRARAVAEAARVRLTGGAGPTEVASWPNKAARAHRFRDGVASAEDIAALTLEAARRGQDPAELAAVQIAKEGRFAAMVARIDGAQAAALKAVAAAAEMGSGDPDHMAKIVSGFAGGLAAAAPAG